MNHPPGVVEDLHPHGAGWPVRRFCKCDRRRDVWSDDAIIGLNVPPGGRFQSGSSGPKAAQKRRRAASIPAAPSLCLSPRARR
jgi:hypothetical protein